MLDQVKRALRITSSVFDDELTELIEAGLDDLGVVGVDARENQDKALISRAVITYCKVHFGEPDQYDRLKAAYDEQKAQLMIAQGYTGKEDADETVR